MYLGKAEPKIWPAWYKTSYQNLPTRARARDPDKTQDTKACSCRIIDSRDSHLSIATSGQCTKRRCRRYARPAPALFWSIRTAANRRKPRNPTHSTHATTLFKHLQSTGRYSSTAGIMLMQLVKKQVWEGSKDGMLSRITQLSRSGTIILVLWVHAGRCRLSHSN
jgi:hypothetical protein